MKVDYSLDEAETPSAIPGEAREAKRGDAFYRRHIGPRDADFREMLDVVGCDSMSELLSKTIPESIRLAQPLSLPCPLSEGELLHELRLLASKNKLWRSFIGMGYANTLVPPVIQRCIFENPGWYTQYTPYQAEISQGRLEALLNFQTMVIDLSGLPVANASLLDEGTAAAEAMTLSLRAKKRKSARKYFVVNGVHPTTLEVLKTRAEPLDIELVCGSFEQCSFDDSFFGALFQYPASEGRISDPRDFIERAHRAGMLVAAASDLLSLMLLKSPGEMGADICFGSAQRFGVSLGFGGPHAAFFAVREELKREIPGRLVGVSKDKSGKQAYRLALQTREQHIRRERATSNICTAQVLLAVMSGMYAVYYGPAGLRRIARRTAKLAALAAGLACRCGCSVLSNNFFDTLQFEVSPTNVPLVLKRAEDEKINLRLYNDAGCFGATFDETTSVADVCDLVYVLSGVRPSLEDAAGTFESCEPAIPEKLLRTDAVLQHPVFNSYHSEAEFVRYVERLRSKDLSLTTSMIPLGSCTMKLNAAVEMLPLSWPEFTGIHPFVPKEQAEGTLELICRLEGLLGEITGLPGVSLQPNAGSQGEYTGLLLIRAYHRSRGEAKRNICLIPVSAHGTNPASAVLAGMEIQTVRCDDFGNVDLKHLQEVAEKYADRLSAMMLTYPSTHGVFENSVTMIAEIVHRCGGLLYMDGANLNAQVGLCRPGDFGVDVCHLNLHKTFAIPHGGGGPGVGPVCCNARLRPFLPKHIYAECGGDQGVGAVSSAPWGSASVLLIPYAYISLMGEEGLRKATQAAILNANYIAARLEPYFRVLYRGEHGYVAHECILDLRNLKKESGVDVSDVAKRLMDYGFHAPTVSFPVAETLMVEPTESESKAELDRFCEAMISIHAEIKEITDGKADKENNLLKNAPHTAEKACSDSWSYPYSRERAVYPLPYVREHKFWPAVSRIDNAYGDRNLFCSCPFPSGSPNQGDS